VNIHIEQGTAILFGMTMAIIALVIMLAIVVDYAIRMKHEADAEVDIEHAACIAHIADVTSKRFIAVALRDLAERYDSNESRRVWAELRKDWSSDGPSMPALWLQHYADKYEKGEDA
jgi:hypothetical protein